MDEEIKGYEDDETNLTNAFERKEIALVETIVVKEMATNFILRRMDATVRLVREYTEVREYDSSAHTTFFVISYISNYPDMEVDF